MKMKHLIIFLVIFLIPRFLKAQNIIETDLHCVSKNMMALKYYDMGTKAFQKKEYGSAVRFLQFSVRFDSTFCDAWNNLGLAYRFSGKWENGMWAFMRALVIDSTYYVSWLNISEHFYLVGNKENAIISLNKLLEILPGNYYGYKALGKLYYEIGEYDSSLVQIERSLEIKIENTNQVIKAYDLFELGRMPEFKDYA
jgi:tetratricopeptide (TPR) repeat protein